MTYSVRNIAIAVVMAIAAAAAVLVYTTSYRQSVTRGQQRVKVMVATRDIPAGTPIDQALTGLQLTSILSDDKTPGALTSTAGLTGKVAAQTIYTGQQVVAAVFAEPSTQAAPLQIAKNERAVRIVCSPDPSCLLGDVQAGDKVDVFATIKVKPAGAQEDYLVSRLLVAGVRVIAVPAVAVKKTGLSSGGLGAGKQTVMIAVDQRVATKFTWAEGAGDQGAQLWLAVRPPDASAEDESTVVETVNSMIFDNLTPSEITKLQAVLTPPTKAGN